MFIRWLYYTGTKKEYCNQILRHLKYIACNFDTSERTHIQFSIMNGVQKVGLSFILSRRFSEKLGESRHLAIISFICML